MTLVKQEVHTDPVCHMQVDGNSVHHLIHRGITHWFCSNQCLESFQENPDLYVGLHHSKIPKVIPIVRRISVSVRDGSARLAQFEDISEDMGLLMIQFDGDSLSVKYDLRQLTWAYIEGQLIKAGISFPGFFSSIRRGLWRFTERNQLKNLAHWSDAACCNHPPSGSK